MNLAVQTLLPSLRRELSGPSPPVMPVLDCAKCPLFAEPAALPIATGVTLIIGLAISYFFQFLSFYRLKSSKGMSSFTLALALLSSLLTFINFLILHWTTIVCCACVEYSRCMAANLTPLQLFVNVLCLLFVYSAFLWYYPLEPFSIFRQQRKAEYLRARIILGVVILLACIVSGVSALLYYGLNLSPGTLATYGKVIGIISAVVVVVQWAPQIFTTFQLGSAGSLSVIMLMIQLPGCLLTVFFQAVIGGADITTWGPYLVAAINTMILIVMCGVFWIRNRNGVPEENFDIVLSEDEHHEFEYDKDHGGLARKSYGALSTHYQHGQRHPPSVSSTPTATLNDKPPSGKVAWSLSDRTGFKGKLSAATFITSASNRRTRAHLSGRDLLSTSNPPDDNMDSRDDLLGDPSAMFSRWDGDSADQGSGRAQPPPATRSARYLGTPHPLGKNGIGVIPPPSPTTDDEQLLSPTEHRKGPPATPSFSFSSQPDSSNAPLSSRSIPIEPISEEPEDGLVFSHESASHSPQPPRATEVGPYGATSTTSSFRAATKSSKPPKSPHNASDSASTQ